MKGLIKECLFRGCGTGGRVGTLHGEGEVRFKKKSEHTRLPKLSGNAERQLEADNYLSVAPAASAQGDNPDKSSPVSVEQKLSKG